MFIKIISNNVFNNKYDFFITSIVGTYNLIVRIYKYLHMFKEFRIKIAYKLKMYINRLSKQLAIIKDIRYFK